INVENLDQNELPQPKPLLDHVASITGSAAGRKNESLVNVGPSIHYRLVGDDGQSHEFVNYMLPIELDGSKVYLAGVRRSPAEQFRYIRFPMDEKGSVNEFMDLRAALSDPAMVQQAVQRFAQQNSNQTL